MQIMYKENVNKDVEQANKPLGYLEVPARYL